MFGARNKTRSVFLLTGVLVAFSVCSILESSHAHIVSFQDKEINPHAQHYATLGRYASLHVPLHTTTKTPPCHHCHYHHRHYHHHQQHVSSWPPTLPRSSFKLVWEDTQDAANACPFHLADQTILQSSILNPPFRVRAFDLWDGALKWESPMPQDADVAYSPFSLLSSTTNTVLLEYNGDERNQLLLTNIHTGWKFQPDHPAGAAQTNPVLLMRNQTEVWFCFTPEDTSDIQSQCVFLQIETGMQAHPSLAFPPGFALWQQQAAELTGTAVFLLRNERETRLFSVLSNSTLATAHFIDRLPRQTEMLCVSPDGQWIVTGFHNMYIYKYSLPKKMFVWYTTILPPNHDAPNIHPAACTFSPDSKLAAISWFLDQVRESQLFLSLYQMPFEPTTNADAPRPFATWHSEHAFQIALPDKISTLQFAAWNATDIQIVAGTYGTKNLDGTQVHPGSILLLRYSAATSRNIPLQIETSISTRGSLLSAYSPPPCFDSSNNLACIVFCSKQCHAFEACAGGQVGVVKILS